MPLFLFVVNRPAALRPVHGTAWLLAALLRRGVRVAVCAPCQLLQSKPAGPVTRALVLPAAAQDPEAVCRVLQAAVQPSPVAHEIESATAIAAPPPGMGSNCAPIFAEELDAVWLRCNPHLNPAGGLSAIAWAQVLAARGVLCLNAPAGLWRTADKAHLFELPAEVRPRSLLSRNQGDLLNCIRFLGRTVVLKPAHGFGGEQVFIVERGRFDNLNAILALLLARGPVLVQEYLQAAADGDRRVLLWNGRPLEAGGQMALYRRMRPPGDLRNNLHVGGRRAACRFNRNDAGAIEAIGEFLRRHGLYFAGADIIGGRVLEINGWAPGGIHNINELYRVRIDDTIAAQALAALAMHRRQRPVVATAAGRAPAAPALAPAQEIPTAEPAMSLA